MTETLRPEQERAMRYVELRGTRATAASIRQRLAASFDKLGTLLDGVGEKEARLAPAPGSWSVQEVADHLIESNRPALDQLEALLDGRSPEGGPVPVALQSEQPRARPWAEVREELAALHRRIEERAAGADDSLPQTATAPVAMLVRSEDGEELIEWEEALDWKAFIAVLRIHVLEHVAQVERTLGALREGS